MPYHIRVTRKSDLSHDCLELDLSKKTLQTNIINLYSSNKRFSCGGVIIDPDDVEEIKINYTKEKSSFFLPKIRENRKKSRYITPTISDDWYVTKEGTNVTRNFIKHIPTKESDHSKNQKKETNLTKYTFILAFISLLLLLLDYLGYLPTQFLTPESNLTIDVASKYGREIILEYGQEEAIDAFNPLAQNDSDTKLNLWLKSERGHTIIYTETIRLSAEHFWVTNIKEEQCEIKPDQTISIPLEFIPVDDYWSTKTCVERENAILPINVIITYNTKGKVKTNEFSKAIPVSSLNEYYNKLC